MDDGGVQRHDREAEKNAEVVKQRLMALPYLKGITLYNDILNTDANVKLANGDNIDIMYITGDAARMYGLTLIEGELPSDTLSMDDYACVANEAAIKSGHQEPRDRPCAVCRPHFLDCCA